MQKVTINPSIATVADIKTMGLDEKRFVFLNASANWPGSYKLTFWNSPAKVSELSSESIEPVDSLLTIPLSPKLQVQNPGNHYYEVFSAEFEAVILKGDFVVTL